MEVYNTDQAYSYAKYPGIAFSIVGLSKIWIEDYDEWVDDHDFNMVTAVMIGDDEEFVIDIDDLIAIEDTCSCGQIGCNWDL